MIGCTDRSDFWEFYVKDNGKGIEKNTLKKYLWRLKIGK
jgi:hypothetical protein